MKSIVSHLPGFEILLSLDFRLEDTDNRSPGMMLVQNLAYQLDGSLSIDSTDGATFSLQKELKEN